jgi:hypothetical protein
MNGGGEGVAEMERFEGVFCLYSFLVSGAEAEGKVVPLLN